MGCVRYRAGARTHCLLLVAILSALGSDPEVRVHLPSPLFCHSSGLLKTFIVDYLRHQNHVLIPSLHLNSPLKLTWVWFPDLHSWFSVLFKVTNATHLEILNCNS